MTYIGAEVIISPLGTTAGQNWEALLENRSGISLVPGSGHSGESLYLSKMSFPDTGDRFTSLLIRALATAQKQFDAHICTSPRTIVIISSTKGSLDTNITDPFQEALTSLKERFKLVNQPLIVSNACISGVLAINVARNYIDAGIYDHAIVIGCDVVSDFVVYGFQSLFAISDKACAPFDADRNGISMGEGCGAALVSASRDVFRERPVELLPGASANDANHISGPSRTGEGLFRTVKKTLEKTGISGQDIDYISAHGTATVYNDEMESIAFDRLNLTDVPLNSLKGYFGHTLGAAGVIETASAMQSIRAGMLVSSLGFHKTGTSKTLNVISENRRADVRTVLKTASGFGGGNASLILRRL